jgi:hypothetical protein
VNEHQTAKWHHHITPERRKEKERELAGKDEWRAKSAVKNESGNFWPSEAAEKPEMRTAKRAEEDE